jgi:hypothetical protein
MYGSAISLTSKECRIGGILEGVESPPMSTSVIVATQNTAANGRWKW